MIFFLSFKDFKYYFPINQQPKFEDTVKENNNNNCVINIVDITTLNSVLYSLNGLNNFNQNNVMIYKLSRPQLMGSTGNLGKLNDDDDLIVKTRYIMKISSNLDINIFG